jgi:hypothetical protein
VVSQDEHDLAEAYGVKLLVLTNGVKLLVVMAFVFVLKAANPPKEFMAGYKIDTFVVILSIRNSLLYRFILSYQKNCEQETRSTEAERT